MNKRKSKTEQETLEDNVGKYSVLEALARSEGGKYLREASVKDIISSLEILGKDFKTLSLQEFISIGAKVHEKFTTLKTLTNSIENKKGAIEALEEYLKRDTE